MPLPEALKFLPEHQRTLQNLAIDERSPGTILHDFDTLLDLLRQRELPITASHQLPMRILSEINERLARPIQLGLKRPQQKSYPPIQGLYLLVRASGLTYVGGDNAKPVLILDQEVYQQWTSLNPTERYCGLLETWFLRGKSEIFGDYDRFGLIPVNFGETASFYFRIPGGGLRAAGNREIENWLKYSPGWHNLGLLDLFGLIRVQPGVPEPGKSWQIERIDRTPFGDALLAMLYTQFFEDLSNVIQLEAEGKVPLGVLQSVLQPCFPDWKHNLSVPEWAFREGTYTFKVSRGSIWRRVAIGAQQPLDELAWIILRSVKFDNDHLYEFAYRTRFGVEQKIRHPYMEESPDTSEVRIGDLPLRVGQTMIYLFDFGDQWEFNVTLEQVDSAKTIRKARILETQGESPEQYPTWDE